MSGVQADKNPSKNTKTSKEPSSFGTDAKFPILLGD
jgi:hypothetical protein